MHTDLSPHLHTEECNKLIELLYKCREEEPFLKWFGKCNNPYNKMLKCLKAERIERRNKSFEKSEEMKAKLHRRFQENREKRQGEHQTL